MARVPSTSIARNSSPAQSALNRKLRRWLAAQLCSLRDEIIRSASRCAADHYRKHFFSFSHACLLLFHGLSHEPSLRLSYASFAASPGLMALSGLASPAQDDALSVSFSQFAASNTSRPAAFLGGIVPVLVERVRKAGPVSHASFPIDIHLLDSTILCLSLLLAPTLPRSLGNKAAMRVQLEYSPALDLPEQVLVTDTRTNDCLGLDRLILDHPANLAELRDQTLIFDLGYYSHRRFERLLKAGVHFVSRLHPQASLCTLANLPVQRQLNGLEAGRIQVLSDRIIRLGSSNNRAGAVLERMRLVEARVEPLKKAAQRGARAVVYRIVTDRWDLEAVDVIQLYLWRWQIELFLRWLKSHVRLDQLLGYSRNAIELSVWLAIIVHLLSVLAAKELHLGHRTPTLLALMRWALPHLEDVLHCQPHAEAPYQLPLPAWDLHPNPP